MKDTKPLLLLWFQMV